MENSLKKRKKKKGFTLIELVIVLAVMGIIALIAIPSLMGTKENFKVKADKRSCETIERAVKVVIAGDDYLPEDPSFQVVYTGSTSTITGLTKPAGIKAADEASYTTKLAAAITKSLTGVGVPQSKPTGKYTITITAGVVKAEVTD